MGRDFYDFSLKEGSGKADFAQGRARRLNLEGFQAARTLHLAFSPTNIVKLFPQSGFPPLRSFFLLPPKPSHTLYFSGSFSYFYSFIHFGPHKFKRSEGRNLGMAFRNPLLSAKLGVDQIAEKRLYASKIVDFFLKNSFPDD